MPEPAVDLVIAVHTLERPIGRAVRSVLEGNGDEVRLTVVCHNVASSAIASRIGAAHRDRVRYLELHDGLRSPAGPFNYGMRAASAPYVSIMGSDDELEPGACQSWLRLAEETGAEAVIARLVRGARRLPVPTPPTRPFRRSALDGTRDRLSYRSAPLGLVARQAIERLGLELDGEVPVGDDVSFVTRLWFEGRVAYDRTGPAYVIGEDAADRVTYTTRPIRDELAFVWRLLKSPWFAAYRAEARAAVATKLLRIHVFGVILNRRPEFWDGVQREELAAVARELLSAAPAVTRNLSVADTRLLVAVLGRRGSAEELMELARARRRHGAPRTVLTPRLRDVLRREAPVRLMTASVISAWGGPW